LTGTIGGACDGFTIHSGGGAFSLAADESFEVTVEFKPVDPGVYECGVETDNPGLGMLPVTGYGDSDPLCRVEPATLDFGSVAVGKRQVAVLTITNAGGGRLEGRVSGACDHFQILSGEGSYNLGAGDEVTVRVRFTPPGSGNYDCVIETGSPDCGVVPCSGRGVETKPYLIVCRPPGWIFYGGACVNEEGHNPILELGPGPHRFEASTLDRPNDMVPFEYTVRSNDSNNKLILNIETGDVEPGTTDLAPQR
jgi:hypothetical protein